MINFQPRVLIIIFLFAMQAKAAPPSDVDYNYLRTTPQYNWGRNLFLKSAGFKARQPGDQINPDKFHLEAIIYDYDDPVAIVDGNSLGIGDFVADGLRVEAIAPSFVIIKGEGLHFELTLPPVKLRTQNASIRELPQDKEP